MKNGFYLFIFLLVLASCKTNKAIVTSNKKAEKISARKVIKRHEAANFKAKTLEARLGIAYSDNKGQHRNRYTFTARLRMQLDSVIWIKGTYKIVSAFRAKITPNSFSYYSPIEKVYFEGDFSLLKKMLGTDITFKQLQNLLLGQSILDLKDQKYISEVEDNLQKLTPKEQNDLYKIFFFFNPNHYKLKRQLIKSDKDSLSLRVEYNGYLKTGNQLFPKNITLNATENERFTFININVRSVKLNEPISFPYRIPDGYKPIEL